MASFFFLFFFFFILRIDIKEQLYEKMQEV